MAMKFIQAITGLDFIDAGQLLNEGGNIGYIIDDEDMKNISILAKCKVYSEWLSITFEDIEPMRLLLYHNNLSKASID
jgi:hypothetical protein